MYKRIKSAILGVKRSYAPDSETLRDIMRNNPQGFKKGYDSRRYNPNDKGLELYKKSISTMLKEQQPAEAISNYLLELMAADDTSPELRFRVCQDVMNRVYGKPIGIDAMYNLHQQMDKDKSLPHLSDAEIEQRISELYDELNNRNRVYKILNQLKSEQ